MVDGLILQLGDDMTINLSTMDLEGETGWEAVQGSDLNGQARQLSAIKSGGTLIINGHGSFSTVSGMNVTTLAKLLADNGLRGPVAIDLRACNTGTFGAPFALELKVALGWGPT